MDQHIEAPHLRGPGNLELVADEARQVHDVEPGRIPVRSRIVEGWVVDLAHEADQVHARDVRFLRTAPWVPEARHRGRRCGWRRCRRRSSITDGDCGAESTTAVNSADRILSTAARRVRGPLHKLRASRSLLTRIASQSDLSAQAGRGKKLHVSAGFLSPDDHRITNIGAGRRRASGGGAG